MSQARHFYDRHGMRRAFHGHILEAFSCTTGYSQKEMKDLLTWMFCPAQFDADGVMVDDTQKSTEAMTDPQYARFLLEVQAWGATFLFMVWRDNPNPRCRAARATGAQLESFT